MTTRETHRSGGSLGSLELDVGLDYHRTIDYDRRGMRKALVQGAGLVRKDARRQLARRAISAAGQVPGRDSGALQRSIGIVARGSKGGWIKIGPRTIPGSIFYPAFLFYGSPKTGLQPRANYMAQALQNEREPIRNLVREALKGALVPR